ncbi:unnamed protein product [Nezara viridula]|uniref:Neurite outgrowth-associated protein n=1 Tax=Nezara viridula TaxID=85310 RepID=A0A9P0E6X1_NEZVI|nr:unnamed protein product [Nezara viridula]
MVLIKLLHSAVRSYRLRAGNGKFNSGISKRLQIIKEHHPDIENVDVTEDSIDNLESGITIPNERVEKNHRVVEFKKIERKFFKKEVYPSLLTWSEKEQIRYLYNLDPTIWSPEKLSESFPATPEIIKKLIKSQWKPMTSQRILHHDTAVKENWKAVETGRLKLPDFLHTHIKSFISRKKTLDLPVPDKSIQTYNPSPASSEFLDIVKNFKDNSSLSSPQNKNECFVDNNFTPSHKGETYVLNQKNTVLLKHKYYTLHQLKKELSNNIPNGGGIEFKQTSTDNFVESQPKIDSELLRKPLNVLPPAKNMKSIAETTVISKHIDKVPLKIIIPKDKMVKSKTHVYKVNDCYYDSNGDFIYKVPGMI